MRTGAVELLPPFADKPPGPSHGSARVIFVEGSSAAAHRRSTRAGQEDNQMSAIEITGNSIVHELDDCCHR